MMFMRQLGDNQSQIDEAPHQFMTMRDGHSGLLGRALVVTRGSICGESRATHGIGDPAVAVCFGAHNTRSLLARKLVLIAYLSGVPRPFHAHCESVGRVAG